jgi:hypothetical protein
MERTRLGRADAVRSRMRCIATPWQQPCNAFSASFGATPCQLGSKCVASEPCNPCAAGAWRETRFHPDGTGSIL